MQSTNDVELFWPQAEAAAAAACRHFLLQRPYFTVGAAAAYQNIDFLELSLVKVYLYMYNI